MYIVSTCCGCGVSYIISVRARFTQFEREREYEAKVKVKVKVEITLNETRYQISVWYLTHDPSLQSTLYTLPPYIT
jgi:polyisoprenoid-binding protein YceI